MLLTPALSPSSAGLVWYVAFAAGLWLIVGAVLLVEAARHRTVIAGYAHG